MNSLIGMSTIKDQVVRYKRINITNRWEMKMLMIEEARQNIEAYFNAWAKSDTAKLKAAKLKVA